MAARPDQPGGIHQRQSIWRAADDRGWYRMGQLGIGILLGPGQFNFDFSAIKTTRVGGLSEPRRILDGLPLLRSIRGWSSSR
jgi:hypothetical protein